MSIPVSIEYFPPKTDEQAASFWKAHQRLKEQLRPEYCSVTFGAGGSTLSSTRRVVSELNDDSQVEVAPHLSCQGGTRDEIADLLDEYRAQGIRRIVALRGDIPSGMASGGQLRYANELVEFIRDRTGDHFRIEVACYPEFHPESDSPEDDISHFRRKVDAGADSAITQYFFNPDAYFRFVDEVASQGVSIPIVPGVMPITNYKQLARFSGMCGAEIPQWMRKRLESLASDKTGLMEFGREVVVRLCQRLIDGGAPGLHIYTLNRSRATLSICDDLGVLP